MGSPFWQQVYHVVYNLDYWLREDYSSRRFLSLTFDKNLSADLGRRSPDYLTKTEFAEYLAKAGPGRGDLALQNMLSLANDNGIFDRLLAMRPTQFRKWPDGIDSEGSVTG